jgi:effector-binding domain-containing protein
MHNTTKKPAIVLETVLLKPMTVLYINDITAISKQNKTIQKDYSVLQNFINKQSLKPGKIMAFYLNYENPLSLEAAVEVDKLPLELPENIHSKRMEGGNAVVAHYIGPYEEMGIAYNAITSMMDDNKKQPKGLAFEVYLNDATTVKSKHELLTDIYQLLQ